MESSSIALSSFETDTDSSSLFSSFSIEESPSLKEWWLKANLSPQFTQKFVAVYVTYPQLGQIYSNFFPHFSQNKDSSWLKKPQ